MCPKKWGGAGVGLLGHTIAFEALAQGCPSTALAFNMHASVVMPILESAEIGEDVKAAHGRSGRAAEKADRRQFLRAAATPR